MNERMNVFLGMVDAFSSLHCDVQVSFKVGAFSRYQSCNGLSHRMNTNSRQLREIGIGFSNCVDKFGA